MRSNVLEFRIRILNVNNLVKGDALWHVADHWQRFGLSNIAVGAVRLEHNDVCASCVLCRSEDQPVKARCSYMGEILCHGLPHKIPRFLAGNHRCSDQPTEFRREATSGHLLRIVVSEIVCPKVKTRPISAQLDPRLAGGRSQRTTLRHWRPAPVGLCAVSVQNYVKRRCPKSALQETGIGAVEVTGLGQSSLAHTLSAPREALCRRRGPPVSG